MLHIFKQNGHRAAYDSTNRVYYPLSSLAMKIIETVEPPLTPECPSSLRYALAKYDSNDLAQAYGEVYALYNAGLLFSDSPSAERMPAELYTVISGSAEAACDKLQRAIASGSTHIIISVNNASVCLATSLRQTYGSKCDLKIILDIPADQLSDADIETLNEAECYTSIGQSSNGFTASVLALADRGIRFIHADPPTGDAGIKETVKLAKEIEKRRKDGKGFVFAPFVFAMLSKEGFNPRCPGCGDCWAKEICAGYRLDANGKQTTLCDTERALIECSVTLDFALDD